MNYSFFGNIYKRLTTLKLASLVMASFLLCILFSAYALAQNEHPELASPFEGNLILGVRTAAYDIGHDVSETQVEGFCGSFGERLKDELEGRNKLADKKIQVLYKQVENNYLHSEEWGRYNGLRDNWIHVECGPNSRPSDQQTWAEGIRFSKTPFHKSGIRLLLKQSLLDIIEEGKIKSLAEGEETVKILALKNTNTPSVLKNTPSVFKGILNFEVVTADSQDEALDKLEESENFAYASDALIINDLFIRDSTEIISEKGKTLKKGRTAYDTRKDTDYTVFPNDGSYLAGESETYIIAIKDETPYADELIQAVDNTLNSDFIKGESSKLKEAERIPTIEDDEPKRSDWNLLLIVVLIFLLMLLGIQLIQNRNRNKLEDTPKTSHRDSSNAVNNIINIHPVSGDTTINVHEQNLTETAAEIRRILDRLNASTPVVKIAESKALVQGSELPIHEPSLSQKLVKVLEVSTVAALEKSIDHPLAVFFIAGFKEIRNQSNK